MGIHLSAISPSIPATPLTDQAVAIQKTLTVANTAEDLVLIPVGKKGRKFSIINMGPGAAYVAADAVATLASVKLPEGADWQEDKDIEVSNKFSFIGETGATPTLIGVVWCGV